MRWIGGFGARVLCFAATASVGAWACRPSSSTHAEGGGAPAPSSDPSTQVLARVGGRTITLADYAAALDHLDEFDRMRYEAPERRRELLDEMIDVMLLADEARDRGYDKDPATQEEMRTILREAMLKKARRAAPSPADIPESEVRAYYDAHRADFRDPERRRVAAIVLSREDVANAVLAAAEKGEAAQWGGLVRAKSLDPQASASVPGDLAGDFGFVSPPGDARESNARVPEEVRAAVFEIDRVGDVLPRPVKANGRYYVVKLAARSEGHDRSLEDVSSRIRVKIAEDTARSLEEALLAELRKRYPVRIDESVLSQVRVTESDGGPKDEGASR